MRSFIAIDLPGPIRVRLAELSCSFASTGVTLVKEEAYHITLQFLGDMGILQQEKVCEAMNENIVPRFKIGIIGVSCFSLSSLRVIFACIADGADELKHIYYGIDGSLRKLGIAYEARGPYVPHVTIARVGRWADPKPLLKEIGEHSNYAVGSFNASSISLVGSRLAASGPEYKNLYEAKF